MDMKHCKYREECFHLALLSAIKIFACSLQTHEDRPRMSLSLEEKRKLKSYHVKRSNLWGSLILDQNGPKRFGCKRTELKI